MKLYRFELLFFDGTVFTRKFCVCVPLNNQTIYLSIKHKQFPQYLCCCIFTKHCLRGLINIYNYNNYNNMQYNNYTTIKRDLICDLP